MIKYSKGKKKLQEVTQKDKNFRNLERQAAEVISVITNSKLKYQEGQEVVDVCAAIEEMKMDSRTEGRIEGKIEGRMEGKIEGRMEGRIEGRMEGKIEGSVETYREVNFSLEDTIQRVAAKFNLPLQKSEEEVRKYWK